MIKKILIILTSITIIPVLFWAIKTTYELFYILFELPKVMEGSVYSKENYEMLVGSSGASATSFIVVLFVLINVLLILLHKGTFSELRKKISAFTQQLICFIYLITSSIRLRIFPWELLGFRVFYISGIMLFLSILLTVINTVGLIKTNKRAKNASCLKEDVV